MGVSPLGLHHVTAIADDPQGNVDFYLTVLGLRLIKQTVNFDDPSAYHLYYGDDIGLPSTIMTFFAWPGAPRGRRGAGQASTTAFSVPEGSLGWWRDRLEDAGVTVPGAGSRLEEDVLTFFDPDGLALELVAHAGTDERPPWERGPVPGSHAIRGLHSVTLTEDDLDTTAGMLTGTLGFRPLEEAGGRSRFEVGTGGAGAHLDVVAQPGMERGLVAVGTVHHVAWRAPDEATQLSWREQIVETGTTVTPVIDRKYFRSIYFREPGGVLLEVATDGPGFTVDEPADQLGLSLQLPVWLEDEREQIERHLPPLRVPVVAPAGSG